MNCVYEFTKGQPVKHKSRILHEATFVEYTKNGRVKVRYNHIYPYGVYWVETVFNSESIRGDRPEC